MNQKSLFQKAEIKKQFLERSIERSLRLRQQFSENYEQFLNQSLSSTLLKGKEMFLNLKIQLITELKEALLNLIKEKIDKNYLAYINFLVNSISEVKKTIDKPQEIELIFNNKDYNYFIEESDKIEDLFQNPVEINKDHKDFIGGFKISLIGGVISYDYTIDNLIEKISPFIQWRQNGVMTAGLVRMGLRILFRHFGFFELWDPKSKKLILPIQSKNPNNICKL